MHKTMIIAASLLATATLFAVTPGVATAASPAPASVAVRYADLDLSSPAGQQQLDRRIARAARAICGTDETISGSRLASTESSACYRSALRDVRQRVAAAIEIGRNGG